jgi:hypothetical protein
MQTLADRFWAKAGPPQANGCREWRGSAPHGAGELWYGPFGRTAPAHYVAWFLEHGYWPAKGAILRHSCGNRLCVAVHHLV